MESSVEIQSDQRNSFISLTPVVIVPLIGNNDKENYKVRTLLDSGSESNWISKEILKHIKYTKIDSIKLKVQHFNGEKVQKFDLVQIYVSRNDNWTPRRDSFKCLKRVSETLECLVYDGFFHHRMVHGIKRFVKNTGRVSDGIVDNIVEPSGQVSHQDINLGTALVLSSTGKLRIIEENSQPIIMRKFNLMLEPTVFGYAVSGNVPPELAGSIEEIQAGCINPTIIRDKQLETSCHFIGYQNIICPEENDLEDEVRALWEKELSLGVLPEETHSNDDLARQIFREGVKFDEQTGQYVTPLPFNGKEIFLKTNEFLARVRTRYQHKVMLNNKDYMEGGCQAFQKMVDKKAVEKITEESSQSERVHYLPHRFVVKQENKTTSYRLVMDASARPSKKDYSLNQCLLRGPNMTMNLAKCLVRFMLGKYRTVSDLEKAFLMIVVKEEHRDVLRFFWPKEPSNPFSILEEWRFRVVLFGSISSPFLLAVVLEKVIAEDIVNKYVRNILQTSIYVDNLNCAVYNEELLTVLYKESRRVFLNRGFNLRKWKSTSKIIQELAGAEGVYDDSETISVLGMIWDQEDRLGFKRGLKWDGKNTKLSALSYTNAVFDPLNRLLPLAVQCRLFLRELWTMKFMWKTDFSHNKELTQQFSYIREQVEVGLKHSFKAETMVLPNTEIHVFGDASTMAFGAVLYLVTPPCKECTKGQVQFIKAKGKLCPPIKEQKPKQDTIPRWELQSLVTAGHLAEFVVKDVEVLENCPIYIWGDNKPALSWCSSSDIEDIYVFRRVSTLRNLCPKAILMYIKSEDNPADILTKPITGEDLLQSKLWWNGPSWIFDKDKWPIQDQKYTLQPVEEVAMHAAQITETEKNGKVIPSTLSSFFSEGMFLKNLKNFTYAIRWRDAFIRDRKVFCENFISVEEFDYAKTVALKIMQKECFTLELELLKAGKPVKHGPCRLMQLFLDSEGIIRCFSRVPYLLVKNKCEAPVLVNAEHPYVYAYIKHRHIWNNCYGTNSSMNNIKWMMHGLKLKKVINHIVKTCIHCARVRAIPYHYPVQPELPMERLKAQVPFCSTGVDLCGPFEVKSGNSRIKIWVCLFTCMVSRAIYLVPLKDISALTFLDALWELSSRRVQPTFIYSDNGTNFTKTSKMLDAMAKDAKVKGELDKRSITWKFVAPYSPWKLGICERLVGLVKKEMDKMCGSYIFTEHDFRQNLFEIERILNNRPLAVVGKYEVITPAHILGGGNPNFDGDFTSLDRDEIKEAVLREQRDLPNLFRQAQERLTRFWMSVWDQYLISLRFSKDKIGNRHVNIPKIGDVCIVWQKDPRKKWRKAIITDVIFSNDGAIRECQIKMGKTITTRPVNHLYSLEINAESFRQKEVRKVGATGVANSKNAEKTVVPAVEIVTDAPAEPVVQVSRRGRAIKPPPGHADYIPFE